MSVLIRKLPYFKSTLMYAPRGPVCDIDDKETFNKIMEEADKLAKKYKSFMLKADPDVLACMDNYHVRLIAPAQMADEEIMKFQSSLREVMLFIKYSKDKENLSRVLVTNEERFQKVERRAADVIEAITNSGIKYDEEDEVVNVCQAIQEIRKESERDGERQGRLMQAQESAKKLYEMGLDTEKIAQAVGYAVETVKGWLG